jgi:hypothetical protein
MPLFYSSENDIRDLTGVNPFAAAFKTRKARPMRWRTLARRAFRRTSAAIEILHQAIVIAKTRRLRHEMLLYIGPRAPRDPQSHSLNQDLLKFPQRPLILGEKWDY